MKQRAKHHAQRAAADDGDGVALARVAIFNAVDGAGQRLGERGVLQRDAVGNAKRVFGDDARGNADVLGVCAVVEEQIVAEIFLVAQAEVADAARRGVERHDVIARSKLGDIFAGLTTVPAISWPKSAGGTIMRA